ncbi:NSMCE4A [Bugula neritina]|uniref:Non-structural maintenance of chromosomes element 4 n=1 Tax=Bugula neritina TaxID=10212 RepID=A0A7J7J425_BUGNE|nr:NSMCE4A [Bugula neritina]
MADAQNVKAAYRQLADEVKEKEDDLIQPKSEALVDVVSRANDLFEKVETANEGAEDSKLMAHIAYIGRKKVQEVKTDAVYFSPSEFVQKLSDYTLQGEEGVLQSEHWTMLGKAVQNFFKRPPTCTFLLGSFAKEAQQKKERVKRVRVEKDDNSKDKSTAVKKIANDDETLETTAHDVSKRVLPQLIKLCDHSKGPIDYYEFVVDPDSFGRTVENMFHVSFLIRDGLAEISLDSDHLPVIRPTKYGRSGTLEGREKELLELPRHQVVNYITIQQWRELIETFKIKKARIPPRKS